MVGTKKCQQKRYNLGIDSIPTTAEQVCVHICMNIALCVCVCVCVCVLCIYVHAYSKNLSTKSHLTSCHLFVPFCDLVCSCSNVPS